MALESIERFFHEHRAPVQHELGPYAGVPALDLLCSRNYSPIETSNVLYRAIEEPGTEATGPIQIRIIAAEEAQLWSDVSARGWSHEHPEL
ncbi:MAG TPA: hypothetical protein VGF08_07325 [Terriglobales bacterium]